MRNPVPETSMNSALFNTHTEKKGFLSYHISPPANFEKQQKT